MPDPDSVKARHHNSSAPTHGDLVISFVAPFEFSMLLLVRLPRPILRIDIEATSCWSLDWANSALIAIGTTNGES